MGLCCFVFLKQLPAQCSCGCFQCCYQIFLHTEMPSLKASFSKHHLLGDTRTPPPPQRGLCTQGVSPWQHTQHPPSHCCFFFFFSAKLATPCNVLSAVEFPGVVWLRCWPGLRSVFGSVVISFCVFPPLARCEGILGSVMSANVMVLIKCNFYEADFLHVGKDVEPCGYYLEQAGLNGLLLIE